MKVLLTGITGNLGHEVARALITQDVTVVPCVRPGTDSSLLAQSRDIVESNLLDEVEITFSGNIDAIVHCAGVVHLTSAHDLNERMMRKVIALADQRDVPVYFVSTAFVYRPPRREVFNNSYEKDKFRAEEVLKKSRIPYTILRPSILTGNSVTGEIHNFSGYYLIVRAFLQAAQSARSQRRKLRFPKMPGTSNIVPIDKVATYIGHAVAGGLRGEMYLTNPNPPQSDWVLDRTLQFFGLHDSVSFVDLPFLDFKNLTLTEEEAKLYLYANHFIPYWGMTYDFPKSVFDGDLIDDEYMNKILTFFRDSEFPHA